jgi:pimeloyl-ACP methyl ester carboxylesterase
VWNVILFGRSSKFGDADKFGQKMVDDVVQLMDHLNIQRAHLVGHSMGALIAANVASRYPNRVSTAALVAGTLSLLVLLVLLVGLPRLVAHRADTR